MSPSRPVAPPSSFDQPSRPGGFGRGFLGGLGGFLVGGLLGSLLFGGLGHGFGGGVGLLDLLLIGALVIFGLSWLRRRQAQAPAPAGGSWYSTPPQDRAPAYPASWPSGGGTSLPSPSGTLEVPAGPSDLDRGLGHIRQMDGAFDAARLAEQATDMFFKVQAAYTVRDISRVQGLLTTEMYSSLQQQCDRLRAERKINRLENIAVRTAQVTEAWQEGGQDFATVYFLASVLDYTTDEDGRQVLEGSSTEPVKFEEFWTLVRPVGPNPWKLSAIQQAA